MTKSRFLIVGAGPAGLTVAKALMRRGRAVKVYDSQAKRPERGIGLWGRSQAVLAKLGLGNLLEDANKTLRIPAAAYRCRSGEWLSASSDTPVNRTRVCTLLESDLLHHLEKGIDVVRGAQLAAAEKTAEGVELTFADGTRVEGTALIGADGVASLVRRLAFGSELSAVDTGFVSHSGLALATTRGTTEDDLELASALDRNAAPIRGLDSVPSFSNQGDPRRAFETLSAGRRFAWVPLASGGAFWFATRRIAAGNVGEGLGPHAVRELRDSYHDWHEPIPALLHQAACASAEAAMASGGGNESHGALRWERLYVAPRLARWHEGRTVLVGDAAHGMPPNLAQGAACAIEGAWLLADALCRTDASDDAALQQAFAEYQGAHQPRVRQCRALTAFTEVLATPATAPAEALRNSMRFVPQPFNSAIFDLSLALSLGDLPSSTRDRWPLAARARVLS